MSIQSSWTTRRKKALRQSEPGSGNDGSPFREAVCRRGAEVSSGKLRQIGTVGPGSTPGPKLAIHGKFYSGIGNDGFPSRRCAKEEAVAEREHDGPDHQEGGGGQSCGAVCAACAPASALPLHQRGRLTIGTNNGVTQTQAHLCMFPGLGSPAFPWKAHKSNQTWLRSRQTSAHCRTCRKHESGGHFQRLQDGVAAGSRHRGHGFGPER